MVEASNRVEGGLWDACAEMRLFCGIGGPCEEELGDDLVESLTRKHICRRKREPAQVKSCCSSLVGEYTLANIREEGRKEVGQVGARDSEPL